MRTLNIKDYIFKSKVPDMGAAGKVRELEMPYPVRTSIINIMFRRELQLSGAELVKQNLLAMKLEVCKDDEILLEDAEFLRIKDAFDKCTGFTRADVELVERIKKAEAEVVEVEAKK